MHTGSCQCGAVRFEVDGELAEPDACHCSRCRKASGHFLVGTDVPRDRVRVTGGENVTWYSSSGKARRGFCRTCGSQLFFDPVYRDWLGITMGAFDGPTQTRIGLHIFTADKGDYYEIEDDAPQFVQYPGWQGALIPWLSTPSDAVALEVGDRRLTQRELAAAIGHVLAELRGRGIKHGARVGVWTHPALETLVAFAALAAGGYSMVPLDPKLGEVELAHVMATAAPALSLETVAVRTDPAPAWTPQVGASLVLFTSGTTGLPKGAQLTEANMVANLDMLAEAWGWTERDTVVHALPLFHVHGLVLGLFGALRRGGALRWVPRFSPGDLSAAVREGSIVFAVPTMYHRLCEAAEADPAIAAGMRRARLLVSGSAPLAVREHKAIERLFGQRPVERYGLTETLINCSTRADGDRRAGSVGPALTGVELRLVDDARHDVADGEPGEIAVRGPHVFSGYVNRPDATAAVKDAGGWFYTGDVATRSADGFITIIGRRSTDIIKCGGFKVGAGEVEAALLDHPAVAEAAVLGAPDPDLGERIVAFVVARSPVEVQALIDHVAGLLTPHKRPRDIRVIAALPRNAMGKVVKAALREQL